MIPFRKLLGFRLLGISIILLALPVLVDTFIFFLARCTEVEARAKKVLEESVEMRMTPFVQLQNNVNKLFAMLTYFLGFEHHVDDRGGKLSEELEELAAINHYHAVLVFKVTEHHRLVTLGSSSKAFHGIDFTERLQEMSPFSAAARKQGYDTSFFYDEATHKRYVYVTKAIYSPKGEPVGLILVMDDFEEQARALLHPENIPFPINFAILYPSSITFASTDPALRYHYFHELTPNEIETFSVLEPKATLPQTPISLQQQLRHPHLQFVWNQQSQLGLTTPIDGTNNTLLAYVSLNELKQAPRDAFFLYYGIMLLIFVLGVLVAFMGTRRLSMPIKRVYQAMLDVKEGELNKPFHPHPLGFEINAIGTTFNEMVETLVEKERLIEEERVAKETYSKELSLGQSVQLSLLPQEMPQVEGAQVAQAFAPAILVGGDFYDGLLKENGKMMLAVADASGKGVQACCYSLTLKNMLSTFARQSDDVAEISTKANNLFCQDTGDSGMFVTVLLAQYDPKSRQLDFYSSGHNAPMHYSKRSGSVEMIDFLDMAMGVMEKEQAQAARRVQLEPGDLFLLYSDGVSEAHNIHQEQFGEERMMQFIQREAHRDAAEFIERMMEELAGFKGEAEQHDDITLVVLKVE